MLLYDEISKTNFEAVLLDDGSLDAVIQIYNTLNNEIYETRFSCDYARNYRDKNGVLSLKGFKKLAREAIEDYFESKI